VGEDLFHGEWPSHELKNQKTGLGDTVCFRVEAKKGGILGEQAGSYQVRKEKKKKNAKTKPLEEWFGGGRANGKQIKAGS